MSSEHTWTKQLSPTWCHSSGPVAYLAQVTHLAGKLHLHCCLFALLLPCCISGTSHTPCREVPSALLPVCSTVSPAYKNFSCSPSFFSSSFLFSFLVFRLVHQSKSQVSSQVRSRLLNQLGLSSALLLPHHSHCPVAYLAQVTHLAGKFYLHCCLFAPPYPLPIRTSPAPPASSLLFSFSSFLVFGLVHQSKSQVSSQVRSRLLNQLDLSSALPLPCHTTKDLPNHNTLHQAMFTFLSCLNNQTKLCQLLEMTSSFATCLQSLCEFKLPTPLPSPSPNTLLTQRSSVVMVETQKSRMRSLRASSRHCHSR